MTEKLPAAGPSPPCRILIVEDEFLIAEDLAEMVRNMGLAVLGPVARVSHALEQLEQTQEPDAAILDIKLAGGVRATPLAQALHTRGVPFLLVTGYLDDCLDELELQDVPCLTKPVSAAQLEPVLLWLIRPDRP